ncbi:GntR family transcriptional regulator, partial [Nocardia gipuzkoensis]
MTSSLPKAARRGLSHEAADVIREAIFAGDFAPGAPLREVELAAALGVSRGSVREGLAVLEREGLIRSGWHRGTTVIEVTAVDVEEVYTLRGALDR